MEIKDIISEIKEIREYLRTLFYEEDISNEKKYFILNSYVTDKIIEYLDKINRTYIDKLEKGE